MKKYHSLYVGMLYVIDTREQYLRLYCLRILFIFCMFVNLWTKEGFLLLLFPGLMTVKEMFHPPLPLSLAVVRCDLSISLVCHLEQAKPSVRAPHSTARFAFFVLLCSF